jgi:acetyl esterase
MNVDKETKELLHQLNTNAPALDNIEVTIELARQGAKAMFLGLDLPEQGNCIVSNRCVDIGSREIQVRLYQPDQIVSSKKPLVVFIHGGGWSLGDVECYDGLVRSLCHQSSAIFVSVEYRLAPEHPFPAGLNDCVDIVNWLRVNGAEIGADTNRIALMGDSAGGNLALVTADKIHRQNAFRLASLYLLYPVVDSASSHQTYASRQEFGNGEYLLTNAAISDTCDWYLGNSISAADPCVSPIFMDSFAHLPTTSVLLAGCDPLYSEGIELATKLKQAGVLRRLTCFESTIHAFVSFGVLPIAREARRLIAEQLKTDLI